jgi:molybdenum cofactor guanylyltransferase
MPLPSSQQNFKNISLMINSKDITTVILCGGQSTRMGRDKALIDYHGLPQWMHVGKMVETIASSVFYSINPSQFSLFKNLPHFIDKYDLHGPINGLMTAFDNIKNAHILLIGIDYPLLTIRDLQLLIDHKSNNDDAVCFYHSEENIAEPLVAIYDERCAALLLSYVDSTARPSIQGFLKTVNLKKINLVKPHNIISFDSE